MTIEKARKILGKNEKAYSDKQLLVIIEKLSNIAGVFVDQQKGLANYES